ncbi:MAG: glycosyltransferase family A protein [Desulfomonilaceae bacterium]
MKTSSNCPEKTCPLFTVFTPTYNRAHTLGRVYTSLKDQTLQDFEWLIVDDGSSDNTRSLIESWISESSSFPIRYFYQTNRGKHVAINNAVREAHGFFFIILDSDDTCVPEALERFAYHWQAIDESSRDFFLGVTSLCRYSDGRLVGVPFPRDAVASNHLEMIYKFRIKNEMWLCIRTAVMKEFPFPEPDVRYFPEATVWTRMARVYKTLYVNEMLRVYWQDQPSLLRGASPQDNAAEGRLALLAILTEQIDWFGCDPWYFLRCAIHYARFSFHSGFGTRSQFGLLTNVPAKILWLVGLPIASAVYMHDRNRG